MIFFSFSDQTIGSLCVFWVKQMQIIFCFVKNLKMLYELLVRFKSFFAFGRTQNIVSVVDQMQMIFRFWENLKRLYYIVEKRKKKWCLGVLLCLQQLLCGLYNDDSTSLPATPILPTAIPDSIPLSIPTHFDPRFPIPSSIPTHSDSRSPIPRSIPTHSDSRSPIPRWILTHSDPRFPMPSSVPGVHDRPPL